MTRFTKCSISKIHIVRRPHVPKKPKYVKMATYCWGYGASITKCAHASKLGLRRTRVLYRQLDILRGSMSVKLDKRLQDKAEKLLRGEKL